MAEVGEGYEEGTKSSIPSLRRKSFILLHFRTPDDVAAGSKSQGMWPHILSWLHALSLPMVYFHPGLLQMDMTTFSMDPSTVPVSPCESQLAKVPMSVYQEASLLLIIKEARHLWSLSCMLDTAVHRMLLGSGRFGEALWIRHSQTVARDVRKIEQGDD